MSDIAKAIDGEIQVKEEKDKSITIESIAVSPETSTENDIAVIIEQKYFKSLNKIKAKALILPDALKGETSSLNCPVIFVKRARLVLKSLLQLFERKRFFPACGIDPTAVVDLRAKIGKNSAIGANVFIGQDSKVGENVIIYPNVYIGSNVEIGDNGIIYPNCSIADYTKMGNRIILHSGVVVGSDGYSYVTEEESNLEKAKKGNFNFNLGRQVQHKIPSIGSVIIEDDVEIGANTCIDSGTIGSTVIGAGTKIDNLVQIAHNCKIGKDCLIVGQVGFAGSVKTGDRIIAGGQVGFADNINIGSDVIFLAKAGVHGNIPGNSVYMGFPAMPYMEYLKNEKALRRMPRKHEKLEGQVKELEEKIKQLENKLDTSLRGALATKQSH
ncbi:MAG: hypothetical protein A3B68_00340 [Candidatus Melainabacteria bacterium RIFCSPHIGHO2_02_FULL_34_12]|nr:MAG: hypothetical protein A3B68_00340 [Candidatus Melainabacteria bacterium RIFCSPHIGHO2_02_FULL_34_12]